MPAASRKFQADATFCLHLAYYAIGHCKVLIQVLAYAIELLGIVAVVVPRIRMMREQEVADPEGGSVKIRATVISAGIPLGILDGTREVTTLPKHPLVELTLRQRTPDLLGYRVPVAESDLAAKFKQVVQRLLIPHKVRIARYQIQEFLPVGDALKLHAAPGHIAVGEQEFKGTLFIRRKGPVMLMRADYGK